MKSIRQMWWRLLIVATMTNVIVNYKLFEIPIAISTNIANGVFHIASNSLGYDDEFSKRAMEKINDLAVKEKICFFDNDDFNYRTVLFDQKDLINCYLYVDQANSVGAVYSDRYFNANYSDILYKTYNKYIFDDELRMLDRPHNKIKLSDNSSTSSYDEAVRIAMGSLAYYFEGDFLFENEHVYELCNKNDDVKALCGLNNKPFPSLNSFFFMHKDINYSVTEDAEDSMVSFFLYQFFIVFVYIALLYIFTGSFRPLKPKEKIN